MTRLLTRTAGHFQEPGLAEARSAVLIPVIRLGEATLVHACTLGRKIGLVPAAGRRAVPVTKVAKSSRPWVATLVRTISGQPDAAERVVCRLGQAHRGIAR